jgi:hypothetical protein
MTLLRIKSARNTHPPSMRSRGFEFLRRIHSDRIDLDMLGQLSIRHADAFQASLQQAPIATNSAKQGRIEAIALRPVLPHVVHRGCEQFERRFLGSRSIIPEHLLLKKLGHYAAE